MTGHWAAKGATAITAEPGSCHTHWGGWGEQGACTQALGVQVRDSVPDVPR